MEERTAGERTAARRWRIRGMVQGVGFRWWTRKMATALGISGWVRNEEDGSVRVAARGASEALDELGRRLSQGPPGARVTEIDEEEVSGGLGVNEGEFRIRH